MAGIIISMLVAIPVIFLWLVIVALLVRPFGIWLPLGPFSFGERARALQALTFPRHVVICGVLCFGCGMLIVTTLSHYLEWKYWHGSSTSLAAGMLLFNVVLWPMAGVFYGLISLYREVRQNHCLIVELFQ
jgi:hypothetical protein